MLILLLKTAAVTAISTVVCCWQLKAVYSLLEINFQLSFLTNAEGSITPSCIFSIKKEKFHLFAGKKEKKTDNKL